MSSAQRKMALTRADCERYVEEGYIVLEDVIGTEELEGIRREADRILELVLNSSVVLGERNPRLDLQFLGDSRVLVRKVQPVNDLSATIAALSSDPRLIGPMSDLMEDEPVLMEEKLNYKQLIDLGDADLSPLRPTSAGEIKEGEFLLHHDWGYYRINGYPDTTMSSVIAIDDCEERGPIRVVPGSHRIDVALRDGSGVLVDGALESPDLHPVNLTAGSVLLFHSKLVHDSEPNRSGLPRRLMIYSHYPRSHDPVDDPDRRNRPARLRAQEMEDKYRQWLDS